MRDPAIRRLMWFFAVVYVVEGIGQAKVGIVWQPLTHFLKQTQGWDPVQVSAWLAVLDLPWILKPLYGIVSDLVPLFGYRRRSYLLVANVAAIAGYAWVARTEAPSVLIAALVLTSVAMAAASTLCGALLVENGQRHRASAAFVNQQWLWFNVALMAASLLGGMLIEWLPSAGALHAAAWIAAVAPVAALACLPLVHERRARIDVPARQRLAALMAAFRSPTLWVIAGFLFCYYFSPGFGTPLYFHMTDRLGFSQGLIGALSSVNAAGWIAGGLLYRPLMSRLETGPLLRISILLGSASTLAYLGMVDPVSAVVIYFAAGVAGMVANIATLALAAEHCPEGAEGFAFAALMSVINLATPVSDMLGSVLYEHVFAERLAPLIVVSAAVTALVLLLLPLLPARADRRRAERA
ncbi:MAG TPA: MFS transporter [Acetobacteraceae bacterium]